MTKFRTIWTAMMLPALSACGAEVGTEVGDDAAAEPIGEVSQAVDETRYDHEVAAVVKRQFDGGKQLWDFCV